MLPLSSKISSNDVKILQSWLKDPNTHPRHYQRAEYILGLHAGKTNAALAKEFNTRQATISKWWSRYQTFGIEGLEDKKRPGKPEQYTTTIEEEIVRLTRTKPPEPHPRWTAALLVMKIDPNKWAGKVSKDYVWRVLKQNGIKLRGPSELQIDMKKEFLQLRVRIAGLYLHKDARALVISANSSGEGSDLANLTYRSTSVGGKKEHKQYANKSITLAEALRVHLTEHKGPGKSHLKKEKRDLRSFIDRIILGRHLHDRIHIILDEAFNPGARRNKKIQHPNIQFHYMISPDNWLIMTNLWFEMLDENDLNYGQKSRNMNDLRHAIEAYLRKSEHFEYPFEWFLAKKRSSKM